MDNKLEDYIRQNRDKLDVEEPDDQFIWEGIKQQSSTRRISPAIMWKAAAVAIVLLTCAYFMNLIINQNNTQTPFTLSNISPELAKEENLFRLVIDEKMKEIENYDIDPSDFEDIFNELDILELTNKKFLEDLKTQQGNPRLIKALLRYYELKIKILERLLTEIEKHKLYENEQKTSEI